MVTQYLISDDALKACTLLETDTYTCVVVHGETILTSTRRGVAPLLDWIAQNTQMVGFSAADRVVGNGAAFLYVLLGVREVYGEVMSKAALATLRNHGILASYGELVEHIVNRTKTGYCPMEEAVRGIEDPQDAYVALLACQQRLSVAADIQKG